MDNYESKLNYLLEHQKRKIGSMFKCPACGGVMRADDRSMQHRAADSKWRRKKFPLFLNSVLNICIINLWCNVSSHRSFGRINDYWAEKLERFLERHPRIAYWVNNPAVKLWEGKCKN